MPVAEQICTPLSADLWDDLSPQASSMDVQNRTKLVAIVTTAVLMLGDLPMSAPSLFIVRL